MSADFEKYIYQDSTVPSLQKKYKRSRVGHGKGKQEHLNGARKLATGNEIYINKKQKLNDFLNTPAKSGRDGTSSKQHKGLQSVNRLKYNINPPLINPLSGFHGVEDLSTGTDSPHLGQGNTSEKNLFNDSNSNALHIKTSCSKELNMLNDSSINCVATDTALGIPQLVHSNNSDSFSRSEKSFESQKYLEFDKPIPKYLSEPNSEGNSEKKIKCTNDFDPGDDMICSSGTIFDDFIESGINSVENTFGLNFDGIDLQMQNEIIKSITHTPFNTDFASDENCKNNDLVLENDLFETILNIKYEKNENDSKILDSMNIQSETKTNEYMYDKSQTTDLDYLFEDVFNETTNKSDRHVKLGNYSDKEGDLELEENGYNLLEAMLNTQNNGMNNDTETLNLRTSKGNMKTHYQESIENSIDDLARLLDMTSSELLEAVAPVGN
ncbi:hypothetical protein BB558_005381 [Smittium angustum]|uniref:Uncharacterized protein n=1 Tax=Smittium angustum TaxID=133377 RepID=A0A2U1J0M3_SMIAN|nr:hypothetical protein BB558_005381 [Smittium angustum]